MKKKKKVEARALRAPSRFYKVCWNHDRAMPRISCHCTVSQKEKTTLCLAKGLPPYWCPTCTWVQNIQQIRLSLSKILSKSADCNNHNITWFHDKSPEKVANHFSPLWDQMQRDKQIFLPHVIWLFEPWNARKVHQRWKWTTVQSTPIWTNPNWTTPHLD